MRDLLQQYLTPGLVKPWLHRLNFAVGSFITQPALGRTLTRAGGGFISSRGFRIDATSRWLDDRIKASLFWRLYERAEVHLIAKYLRPDLAVVELGASIGYTTLHIARKRPPKQVCVEANPRLIGLIRSNLTANEFAAAVEVVHGAVDYSGAASIDFRLSPDNLGSSVLQSDERENPHITDEIASVPSCTLGQIVERSQLGQFSLVCDIEGAEAGMILAESEAIRSRCQLMIIELHDNGVHEGRRYSVHELASLIESRWGMRCSATNDNVFVFERAPH